MGMQQPPKLILNDSGMPWGRWVQSTLQSHDSQLSSVRNQALSVQATQNGQIKRLAGQISNIQYLLSNVSTAESGSNGSTGFALTTTATQRGLASVTVPTGFTRAILQIQAQSSAFLSGSASDYFWMTGSVTVPGADLFAWSAPAVACQGSTGTVAGAGSCYPNAYYSLNVIESGFTPGSSITASVSVHTQGNAWSAQSSNAALINLMVLFLA